MAGEHYSEHAQKRQYGALSTDYPQREYHGELHTDEHAAATPKEVKEGRFIRVFFCATDGEKVPVEIASSGTVTQLRVSVLYPRILSNFSLSRSSERLSCALFCVSVCFVGYWRRVAHANWYHTSPNCGYHGDSADSLMLGEQAMIMQLSGEAIVEDWGDESAGEPHTDVATNALDQASSATSSAKESFLLGRQMQRPQPNDMALSAHYAKCPFTGSRQSPPCDVRNSPSVRWSGSTAADSTGFLCLCVKVPDVVYFPSMSQLIHSSHVHR